MSKHERDLDIIEDVFTTRPAKRNFPSWEGFGNLPNWLRLGSFARPWKYPFIFRAGSGAQVNDEDVGSRITKIIRRGSFDFGRISTVNSPSTYLIESLTSAEEAAAAANLNSTKSDERRKAIDRPTEKPIDTERLQNMLRQTMAMRERSFRSPLKFKPVTPRKKAIDPKQSQSDTAKQLPNDVSPKPQNDTHYRLQSDIPQKSESPRIRYQPYGTPTGNYYKKYYEKKRPILLLPNSTEVTRQGAKLRYIREFMPERWNAAIRGKPPTEHDVLKLSTLRNWTDGIRERVAICQKVPSKEWVQDQVIARARECKVLREKIDEYLKQHGETLAQKPETPAYYDIVNRHSKINEELESLRRALDKEASKDKRAFVPLSEQQENELAKAMAGPDGAVLVKNFKIDMTKKDIRTLREGQWLNDEVINYYGELIMQRAKENNTGYPNIHCFSTFFYPTLTKQGYQSVRRWTKRAKVNIFEKDYVIIPVHLGNHWTCAVINLKQKRFEYYDSLHGTHPTIFQTLREYLDKESQDKKGKSFDFDGWTEYAPKDIPAQLNGNDCGVFTCVFMEYTAREEQFNFDGTHMPYFRKRITCEILESRLMD